MADYDDKAILDPIVLELANRIVYRADPPELGAIRFSGRARIETAGGVSLEAVVKDAIGTGPRKIGAREVELKFGQTAGRVLPTHQLNEIVDVVSGIDRLDSLEPLLRATRLAN